MSEYCVSRISPSDFRSVRQIDALLEKEGIKRDRNLDYIAAVFDSGMNIIATGSAFANTLRCFAVSSEHRGEGILNLLLSHLIEMEMQRGNSHLFVYTKPGSAGFFSDLGFHEIARVDNSLVFMENRGNGFESYLDTLAKLSGGGKKCGAAVINANPFTKGHRYLIEKAAGECDRLFVFVVSEDVSLVPFDVRFRLVKEGTADIENVSVIESGPYIISNATFPSYFLKDDEDVMMVHARLDAELFKLIAPAMGIGVRFVGDEPFSEVTGIYNSVLTEELPKAGIGVEVIPRLEIGGVAVSASEVRRALKNGDTARLKELLVPSSFCFFSSPEAKPVIDGIIRADNVTHH